MPLLALSLALHHLWPATLACTGDAILARAIPQRAPSLVLLALLGGLAASLLGCSLHRDDPYYCPDRPNSFCACRADSDCPSGKPVCETTASNTCVECTAARSQACVGVRPVCGADLACRGCASHAECPSDTCLPDGACAAEAEVAYVAELGTDNDLCTRAAPCTRASKALATLRPYLRWTGTSADALVVGGARKVTVLGSSGARLRTGRAGAPLVLVRDTGTAFAAYDLTISDAPNDAAGYGVLVPPAAGTPSVTLVRVTLSNNPAGGLSSAAATVRIDRSTVAANLGGGLALAGGSVDLTNNFIYRNGNQDNSSFGGVALVGVAATSRLELNTIVDNRAATGAGGVVCSVAGLAAPSNLIARNSLAGSTTAATAQTSGPCTYPTSLVQNDLTGLALEHPDPPAPFRYALTAGSAAIDRATTPSTVEFDFDGDPRPLGAARDVGADELRP